MTILLELEVQFDAPMSAADGQRAFGPDVLRGAARDAQRGFKAERASFFVDGFPLDPMDLPDIGKVEVAVEFRAAPHAPRPDSTMSQHRVRYEMRGAAGLEQQGDIPFQRRLVAFDR